MVDCYSCLLLFLTPFYLEQKFESQTDRDYVEILWSYLIPNNFYNFICRGDYYTTLNKIKLRLQESLEIVRSFAGDVDGYRHIQDAINTNAPIFQYLYSNLFPRYFSRIDDYGIRCRLTFENQYKFYQSQKNLIKWGEYPNQPVVNNKTKKVEVDPPTSTLDEPIEKKTTFMPVQLSDKKLKKQREKCQRITAKKKLGSVKRKKA